MALGFGGVTDPIEDVATLTATGATNTADVALGEAWDAGPISEGIDGLDQSFVEAVHGSGSGGSGSGSFSIPYAGTGDQTETLLLAGGALGAVYLAYRYGEK